MGPVLVIGSTGLVGEQIARQLRADGHRVTGSSRTGERADLACELTDAESVRRAIRQAEPATVVLAGGVATDRTARRNPDRAFEVNTAGAFNLLDAARELGPEVRLLLLSTAAVHGPPVAGQPLREDSPINPSSVYGASKAAAEALFLQHGRSTGRTVTVARLHNQIGPGLPAEHAPGEFARAITEAEASGAGRVTLTVGNPRARRDFTDVRDTARAISALIEGAQPGVFNVCGGNGTSLEEVIAGLASHTELEVQIETDPGRRHHADIDRITGDPGKIREATGWQPEISLNRSLADLLDSCR